MSLDTLRIARELRDADLAPAQAEAIATAIGSAVSDGAATKTDLDVQTQRLDAKIDSVDERLTAKIDSVEERLTAKIDSVDERLTAKINSVEERLIGKIESSEERVIGKIESARASMMAWSISIMVAAVGPAIAGARLF
jgi:uncharacterized protein YicC (UPF0701 family)